MNAEVPESSDPVTFWEQRYEGAGPVWSGRANAVLVDVVGQLEPGRSLDLGCGEGGDVIWLAQHGWRATGIDISRTAIERAEQAAAEQGLQDGRVTLRALDLAEWQRAQDTDEDFDLVTACFLQSPVTLDRTTILRAAADRVAVGGHLLIVSHAAPPPWASGLHDHAAMFHSPQEEVDALGLDPSQWTTSIAEIRTRPATGPDGTQALLDDSVVLLTRN